MTPRIPICRFCSVAVVVACGGQVANTSTDCAAGCGGGSGASASSGGRVSSVGNAITCGTGGAGGTAFGPLESCNGLLSGQFCGLTRVQASLRAANVLLVVDASGSMSYPATAPDSSSKWNALQQALSTVLPALTDDVSFGLELFPDDPSGIDPANPDSSCAVASGDATINVGIGHGAANVTNIIDYLGNYTPSGSTPTAKALERAYTYFSSGAGQCFRDSAWVVLITDGAPVCNGSIQCTADTCVPNALYGCGGTPQLNCCDTSTPTGAASKANYGCLDDQASIAQIQNLSSIGVSTYVIGLPGSEPFAATLNAMADAGGLDGPDAGSGYYAVSSSNFTQDLEVALKGMAATLIRTCDIQLNDSPVNSGSVQVVIDCILLPQLPNNAPPSPDAGVADGFYINYTQTPAHLILTGSYCDNVMANGAFNLDVIEGGCGLY